jgi:serine/threonine-protein kinase PknK
MPIAPGQFGDRYEVLDQIGAGAFSTVFRARDLAFGRRIVVLKVLTIPAASEQSRRRFDRECRAAGRVSMHPNIVAVYDRGFATDGAPYIVLEHCGGGSLAERAVGSGPWRVDDVLGVGVQIAAALQFAHAQGVWHRDVKPENILVKRHGAPALTDFGIAQLTSEITYSSGTFQSFAAVHAAPELLWGSPSPQCDVYSLASTLYQLLAGHAAFVSGDDEPVSKMLERIVESPIPPLVRPDVDDALVAVVMAGMAKDPAQRYASAAALGAALSEVETARGAEPVRELSNDPPNRAAPAPVPPNVIATPQAAGPMPPSSETLVPEPLRRPAPQPVRVTSPSRTPQANARLGWPAVVIAILIGVVVGLVVALGIRAANGEPARGHVTPPAMSHDRRRQR